MRRRFRYSVTTLIRLAELLRARVPERRCPWRRLDPSRQARLVLAHLRNGDTYARLAAGFAIGTSTAWRYVREAAALRSLRVRWSASAVNGLEPGWIDPRTD